MSYVNRKKSQRWISSDMWICTDHIPAARLPVNQAVCWYCKKERPPLEGRGLTPVTKVSDKNPLPIKKEKKSTPMVPPLTDVYQPKSSRPLPARPSKNPTIETPVAMGAPPSKKAPVKKTPVKAPVKPVKKAPVKKAPVKKAPVKKAPVKKAPVVEAVVKTPSTSQCAWSGCSNPNTGTSQYCSRTCSNKNAHARQAERRRNSKKV